MSMTILRMAVGVAVFTSAMALRGQTLSECQQAAQQNYPLIERFDLIGKTTAYTLDNIQKGWLPQVSATAQATLQSDVASWPDNMKPMLLQMGVDFRGLKRDQYRIGVDVSQTVYDGGSIKNQKEMARLQGKVEAAENEVNLYAVRKRVNELYFSLLLIDSRISLNKDLQEVFIANERKLASMLKEGTAAESDYNSVKAERLNVEQQTTNLTAQRNTLKMLLSALCGIEVEKPIMPDETDISDRNNRPELRLIDTQLMLADAKEKMLDSQLLPRLSVFASGFYGYPGYNMFDDMMNRRWSLNGMIGTRLTWNIGALYTRKNDKAKIRLQREEAENLRSVFLFNNNIDRLQQSENIKRYKTLMESDMEIINLRSSVRKAAESKLSHGIIDVNDLVKEINNENAARLQLSIHKIEMLKEMYDLNFTTN
ncbi:MAG: TolC family protein [Prevotella sp.]|nr:TolC family protein [Prevotella sp.]